MRALPRLLCKTRTSILTRPIALLSSRASEASLSQPLRLRVWLAFAPRRARRSVDPRSRQTSSLACPRSPCTWDPAGPRRLPQRESGGSEEGSQSPCLVVVSLCCGAANKQCRANKTKEQTHAKLGTCLGILCMKKFQTGTTTQC